MNGLLNNPLAPSAAFPRPPLGGAEADEELKALWPEEKLEALALDMAVSKDRSVGRTELDVDEIKYRSGSIRSLLICPQRDASV